MRSRSRAVASASRRWERAREARGARERKEQHHARANPRALPSLPSQRPGGSALRGGRRVPTLRSATPVCRQPPHNDTPGSACTLGLRPVRPYSQVQGGVDADDVLSTLPRARTRRRQAGPDAGARRVRRPSRDAYCWLRRAPDHCRHESVAKRPGNRPYGSLVALPMGDRGLEPGTSSLSGARGSGRLRVSARRLPLSAARTRTVICAPLAGGCEPDRAG